MIMKKYIPLLLVLIGHGSFAEEHDGTVNISGTIQDNTCELAPDSQNKKVNLGVVNSSQFNHSGDFSPATTFTLNLLNCGPAASGATVTFSGTPDAHNTALFAIETGDVAATGLALGIYDSTGARIEPESASTNVVLNPGQASVMLDFTARYVAVADSVTAGSANATVTFTVNYD